MLVQGTAEKQLLLMLSPYLNNIKKKRGKDHGDMKQNPTCVTITRSIFMNKKVLVFMPTRQTA